MFFPIERNLSGLPVVYRCICPFLVIASAISGCLSRYGQNLSTASFPGSTISPSKYCFILSVSTGKWVHPRTRQSVFCFFKDRRYLSSTCLRSVSSVIPCSTRSTRSVATTTFILVQGFGFMDSKSLVYIPDFMVHSVARTVMCLHC